MLRTVWGECDVPPGYLHEGDPIHVAPHTVEGRPIGRDEDVVVEHVHWLNRAHTLLSICWRNKRGEIGATAYHCDQRVRLYAA